MGLHSAKYAVEFTEKNVETVVCGLFIDSARESIQKCMAEHGCGWIEGMSVWRGSYGLKGYYPQINIRGVRHPTYLPWGTGFYVGGHPSSEIAILMPEVKIYVQNFLEIKGIDFRKIE
jgi:hypothetical protein